MAVYDGPNLGSEEHADRVWQMATDLLRYLNKPLEGRDRRRNRFRSKVLTKVSWRDKKEKKKKWSVGSSVAVSHFLRPLYLYNRIRHFKPSLKRAVILNEPLETLNGNLKHLGERGMKDQKDLAKPAIQSSGTYTAFKTVKATSVSSVRLNVPSIVLSTNFSHLIKRLRQKMRLHKSLTLSWDSSVKDVGFFMKTLEILHRYARKR